MEIICPHNLCTGCSACLSICPTKSISLIENKDGFKYPYIDQDLCIDCELCVKKCPTNNNTNRNTPLKVFASWSLDKNDRNTSASGGLGSIISSYFINNNGIVYGCAFVPPSGIQHIRVAEASSLSDLKGSKYVQSDLNDTFSHIEADLKDKKEVLFIGTPCQVDGLQLFLGKKYKKLTTVDLVCHGVPSLQMFMRSIPNKMLKQSIREINFRGYNSYIFLYRTANRKNFQSSLFCTLFTNLFIKGLFYRDVCYMCKYANSNRVSDISLGDFWGLGNNSPFLYDTRKVSLVLTNTVKGAQLLEAVSNKIYIEERELKEAVMGNTQLRKPASYPHDLNNKFLRYEHQYGYKLALLLCCKKEVIKYYLFPLYLKIKKLKRK